VNSYLEKLREFANRIAMPQSRSQELERMIRAAHVQVAAQVTNAEEANDVHINGRDSDQVLARLETIFHGRVGAQMPPDQLDAAMKERRGGSIISFLRVTRIRGRVIRPRCTRRWLRRPGPLSA
jgi:hypothetical protein